MSMYLYVIHDPTSFQLLSLSCQNKDYDYDYVKKKLSRKLLWFCGLLNLDQLFLDFASYRRVPWVTCGVTV